MQGGILINGRNAASKKAVKDAIKSNPQSVRFYDTSLFSNGGSFTADEIPAGIHVFVGPDPERSRKFFGNIQRNDAGVIKVS